MSNCELCFARGSTLGDDGCVALTHRVEENCPFFKLKNDPKKLFRERYKKGLIDLKKITKIPEDYISFLLS